MVTRPRYRQADGEPTTQQTALELQCLGIVVSASAIALLIAALDGLPLRYGSLLDGSFYPPAVRWRFFVAGLVVVGLSVMPFLGGLILLLRQARDHAQR